MKHITGAALSSLWQEAQGDFCCIVDEERTLYELNGRTPPDFQRSEFFRFFSIVLPKYKAEA